MIFQGSPPPAQNNDSTFLPSPGSINISLEAAATPGDGNTPILPEDTDTILEAPSPEGACHPGSGQDSAPPREPPPASDSGGLDSEVRATREAVSRAAPAGIASEQDQPPAPLTVNPMSRERIFIELMTSDRKLKASTEGSIYGTSKNSRHTM